MAKRPNDRQFVSRAGLKLAGALDHFQLDPSGMVCADLGANVGGFTDCLLQRGAQKVYAVDTGYGVLEYKLRKDPRVVVMERVNALHVTLPEPMDLVVIDLGWTPQKLILPHAQSLLKPSGHIITLIKPHYEASKDLLHAGILDPNDAERVFREVLKNIPTWNLTVKNHVQSSIQGAGGNYEYLVLLNL